MQRHPVFEELEASLAAVVPPVPVEFSGNWVPATRRTYAVASQSGTGVGPFVNVVDFRWRGTLICAVPVACVAFLVTAAELFWSKSTPAALRLDVDVSLHAHADYSPNLATFTASIGGAGLPGIAVAAAADPTAGCTVRQLHLTTARVELLAQTNEAAFAVLLLQGQFLKVGRHRLWRVRDKLASSFRPRVRDMLTRGRSGSIPWESAG